MVSSRIVHTFKTVSITAYAVLKKPASVARVSRVFHLDYFERMSVPGEGFS